MGMEGYKLESHPVSKKEAIIQGDCYRITMLTSALVRLEYNSEGVFEDRATQSVLNRDFPVPEFKVVEDEVKMKNTWLFIQILWRFITTENHLQQTVCLSKS